MRARYLDKGKELLRVCGAAFVELCGKISRDRILVIYALFHLVAFFSSIFFRFLVLGILVFGSWVDGHRLLSCVDFLVNLLVEILNP